MRFSVFPLDEKLDYLIKPDGSLIFTNKEFTLDQALRFVDVAVKIERAPYGFNVFSKTESVFFRFGNATTRKRDTAESFLRKNWRD